MSWRTYFNKCLAAVELEKLLIPTVREHDGGLASTANTDIERKEINLDVSQAPAKVALSYAYELMNLYNHPRYQQVISMARRNQISPVDYVNAITEIEAEAALFRCEAFHAFDLPIESYPANPKYLELYERCKDSSPDEKIRTFQRYIIDEGIVRKQFSAKAYYLDSYLFYAGKKNWPEKYDRVDSADPTILPPPKA